MKRSSIYIKFILSYIIIFLIPVCIMRLYIDNVLIKEYQKAQLNNTYEVTQNIAKRTDEIFKQINQTMHELTNDYSINRVRYTYNTNNLLEAIKQINSYCVINPYIEEIFYYYKDIDTFVSSDTVFSTKDDYIIKNLIVGEEESFLEFLDQPGGLGLYRGSYKGITQKNFYMMATPYPNVKDRANNMVITFLNADKIIKQIEEYFSGHYLKVIIKDKATGNEILNRQEEKFSEGVLAGINNQEPYSIIENGETKYFATRTNLSTGDLELYMLLELDYLLEGVKYLDQVIINILAVVIVVGLILSLILAEYNYKPIRLLQKHLIDRGMADQIQEYTDEYVNIKKGITYLTNKNKDLESDKSKYDEIVNEFRKVTEESKNIELGEELEDKIYQSRQFIEENYADMDFSVGKVCEVFGYAPNAYTQKFKKAFEETPIQYITELRMAKLKELLITTNLPIKVVIEQVGYRDNSTCSKKFTKIVGMSPSQYREKFSILANE